MVHNVIVKGTIYFIFLFGCYAAFCDVYHILHVIVIVYTMIVAYTCYFLKCCIFKFVYKVRLIYSTIVCIISVMIVARWCVHTKVIKRSPPRPMQLLEPRPL